MSNENTPPGFSEAQKQYLAGFTFGADVARAVSGLPVLSGRAGGAGPGGTTIRIGNNAAVNAQADAGPDAAARAAQDAAIAAGGKLSAEEQAKREKNGLDRWDDIRRRSEAGEFPKGSDVFLTKFHGLFYVAPAQKSFMCRMRIPGGQLRDWQLRGIADVADRCGGGHVDVTTRANLQLREIPADQATEVLYRLRELDITCQGSGADNIRNCTASPLSGVDPHELIETIPLAKRMHHYILTQRDLYGLPRKFNIAFDGGGSVSSLDDTNDIGFHAVQVPDASASESTPAGVYFQLTLGGITGHRDFAKYTGVLLQPGECIEVAAAITRVFIRTGDRTDRKKARLKYVLDRMGLESFLEEVEKEVGRPLRRVTEEQFETADHEDRFAHVGVHRQKAEGEYYIGLVLPVGRLTSEQTRGIADIAERFGRGEVRLTVWQNLIIPHIAGDDLETVKNEIERMGLEYRASSFRAGLVACTGSAGCKFAAADTKRHAMEFAEYLQTRFSLDSPINIHLTGCHHSCAQHYIGDIGLLACQVEQGDDTVPGYHIHVGGGWGEQRGIGRLLFPSVAAEECPSLLAAIVGGYLEHREEDEDFVSFAKRHTDEQLKNFALSNQGVTQ